MTDTSKEPAVSDDGDKRATGLRLRKYMDVVVEDKLSAMLFRAAIADISETGMRVIADQYLSKGSKYTFTMKRSPFLELRGEVRWIKPLERDTFQVGVLFVGMTGDDEKRLSNFLELERKRLSPTSG